MTELASNLLEYVHAHNSEEYKLSSVPKQRFAEIDAFTELAEMNYITFDAYFRDGVAYVKATLLF